MCVVRMTAGSSADIIEGGIESARTRGVVGGTSEFPIKQVEA